MSLGDYFTWEERNQVRHEYVSGEVHAMSGVTIRHNLITLNIVRALHALARSRGCLVLATDVQLLAASDRVYYPDVMMACGAAGHVERLVKQPSIVAEVTSPSTRAIDRREKLEAYMRIPSLRVYLIVDQRRRHVVAYRRDAETVDWTRDEYFGQDDAVEIGLLGTSIALDEIYETISLPLLSVKERERIWGAWEDEEEEDDVEG